MTQGVDKDELAECRFSVDLLPSGMQGWTTIDSPIHDELGIMPSFLHRKAQYQYGRVPVCGECRKKEDRLQKTLAML